MAKTIYLFPDTNVFVQCYPLDQLDWAAWREFDQVHLIVARPVQAEIDDQKNRGRERLAKRARTASSLLRDMILGGCEPHIVRDGGPSVKLLIRPDIRPTQGLRDRLDYGRADDQLVGTVHAFAQEHPESDVRILTHDTGPMASAQMVGVGIAPVPDNWLMPPEPSAADRKLQSLQEEVAKLKEREPRFRMASLDADGGEHEIIERDVTIYDALSANEIAALLDRIKTCFPIATDFGKREPSERQIQGVLQVMGMKEIFTPATDDEINDYRHKYEKWLSACENRLKHLHTALQESAGWPMFLVAARNEGTRPANDALITFAAKGPFQIMPPPYQATENDDEDMEAPDLPPPPTPPKGRWATASQFGFLDTLAQFEKFQRDFPLSKLGVQETLIPSLPQTRRRDPNGFYFKPDRPTCPVPEFDLECAQWRHGLEDELFPGELHFKERVGNISGALECRVHAENLSAPEVMVFPVRVRVSRAKAYDTAQELVEALCGKERS